MDLTHHSADSPTLPAILNLIRVSFAYMDGVIDPPSSMHKLTLDALRGITNSAEIWSVGPPLSACVILTPRPNTLYIGKLCTATDARGTGLSRFLIQHAHTRAHELKLNSLTLEVRVELTDNHAAFTKMGFQEVARTTHQGYAHPTSITFEKSL